MAIAAATVWEVRTTGSDTNGGGYSSGGTDWSQQDAAQYSVTDAVTNGTTTITSASANFGTDVVGNVLYIAGGTGSITAGWYQIASRTNATTIVVDRATGLTTGTGATLKIGGALASPGQCSAVAINGNAIHQKAGTYTVTRASTNVAGGCVSAAAIAWYGYQTTRGDLGTKPVMIADGVITTFTLFTFASGPGFVQNVEFDGNSRTASRAVSAGGNNVEYDRCTMRNCTNSGANGNTLLVCRQCLFTGCSTQTVVGGGHYFDCTFSGNTVAVLTQTAGTACVGCLFYNNTGASTDAIVTGNSCVIKNNTIHGSGRYGIVSSGSRDHIENNIVYGNTSTGIYGGTTSSVVNNATGGNGTNTNLSTALRAFAAGNISLSADPFTNAAGGDFTLNGTSGGGAACKAVASPSTLPGGTTGNSQDLGCSQAVAASGGIIRTNMDGGF